VILLAAGSTLSHDGPTESTVLLEESETLEAELLQEEEAEAKAEAERTRPGLTMFMDGSRLDDGATGYSVVWKQGLTWAGVTPLILRVGHSDTDRVGRYRKLVTRS